MTSTWFDISRRHGVLELPPDWSAPAPALELHIAFREDGTVAFAWWESERGECLGRVPIGKA